jgi:hypothetical protein
MQSSPQKELAVAAFMTMRMHRPVIQCHTRLIVLICTTSRLHQCCDMAFYVHAQALEANAAAPADQRLSDAELVLNSQLLGQLRGNVAAEEAQLLSAAPRKSREQEVQAKRLKAMCWDAFQVRMLLCCSWGKAGLC